MTNQKRRDFTEDEKKRLVGKVKFVKCSKCLNDYEPNDTDISLNGYFYWKNCRTCRAKSLEYYHNKKKFDTLVTNSYE